MNRWRMLGAAGLTVLALLPAAPARAAVATGPVRLVSVTPTGALLKQAATSLAVSGNGRYVAFYTQDPTVVPGDLNQGFDVFVRDLTTRTTTPVSVTPAGALSNGSSSVPSLSGDGRLVSFTSTATNLTAGGARGSGDVYVRDLTTGSTRLVSGPQAGGTADASSGTSALSGNGRYVVFTSFATNLVPGLAGRTGGHQQVYRADLTTGQVVLVSVTAGGVVAGDDSSTPTLSYDGRYVLFSTSATNLGPADPNGLLPDYYRKDLVSGRLDLVSRTPAGTTGNDQSCCGASMSADGHLVAFQSNATDLVTGVFGAIYLRDLRARTTTVGSRHPDGSVAFGGSPSLSADGRLLAYQGQEGPPGAELGGIVVRDLTTGDLTLTGLGVGGVAANGSVFFPTLSANGRRVIFDSDATNLLPHRTTRPVLNVYAAAVSIAP